MIAYLCGTVLEPGVVLTSDGVGYAVRTVDPLVADERVELRVTTTVRETDISLWGFTDTTQQVVFARLTAVPGVGPALAMTVLQTIGVAGVAHAAVQQNPKVLSKTPGVGPSVAKKILASLKLPDSILEDTQAPIGPSEKVVATVRQSLANLGYGAVEVDEAIEQVRANPDVSANDLATSVLEVLSKGAAA